MKRKKWRVLLHIYRFTAEHCLTNKCLFLFVAGKQNIAIVFYKCIILQYQKGVKISYKRCANAITYRIAITCRCVHLSWIRFSTRSNINCPHQILPIYFSISDTKNWIDIIQKQRKNDIISNIKYNLVS